LIAVVDTSALVGLVTLDVDELPPTSSMLSGLAGGLS
jgi:hypothetical protein